MCVCKVFIFPTPFCDFLFVLFVLFVLFLHFAGSVHAIAGNKIAVVLQGSQQTYLFFSAGFRGTARKDVLGLAVGHSKTGFLGDFTDGIRHIIQLL
jgi:hypothetical protein